MKLPHIIKIIIRNYRYTLITIFTTISLLYLIYEVQLNIDINKKYLHELSNTMEVSASINIISQSVNYIPYTLIKEIKDTGFVESEDLWASYYAYQSYPYGNLAVTFVEGKAYHQNAFQAKLLAVSSLNSSLSPITNYTITWGDDYTETEFISNNWVIVAKSQIDDRSLQYGDTIVLTGEYIPENYHELPEYSYPNNLLKGIEYSVAGSYELNSSNYTSDSLNMYGFIVPYYSIVDRFSEFIIHDPIPLDYYPLFGHSIITEPFSNDVNFILQNKENLNLFKKELHDNILPKYFHYDIVIDDTLYNTVVNPLKQQIQTKENLLIYIMVLTFMIQLFISLLATYRKKSLIALLRMMGNKKSTVFYYILLEQLLLCMVGSLCFIILILLRGTPDLTLLKSQYIYLFYISYVLGTILSAIYILRKTPMHLLLKKE